MKLHVFPLVPLRKPRQTQRDKWKPSAAVVRYRAFADSLRLLAAGQRFTFPEAGARLLFTLPMPKSWSRKQRAAMLGTPHQQVPDIDNLTKAVMDALLPEQDCRVWHIAGLSKVWGEAGEIRIQVEG